MFYKFVLYSFYIFRKATFRSVVSLPFTAFSTSAQLRSETHSVIQVALPIQQDLEVLCRILYNISARTDPVWGPAAFIEKFVVAFRLLHIFSPLYVVVVEDARRKVEAVHFCRRICSRRADSSRDQSGGTGPHLVVFCHSDIRECG